MRTGVIAGVLLLYSHAHAQPKRPPNSPALGATTRSFVAFAGEPAQVRLAWPAQPGVARYRATWTTPDGGEHEQELPGTATVFEKTTRTAGRAQLELVAIDAANRESPPTVVAVDIVTVTARSPGGEVARKPGQAFLVGTRFGSPTQACGFGASGARGAVAVAEVPGLATLECGDLAIPIVIAGANLIGPSTQLVTDRETRVHLTFASVAPIGEQLEVTASGQLELGEVTRTSLGLDLPVTARGGTRGTLVVTAGDVELGRVELAIAPAVAPTAVQVRERWFALDVGAHVGMFVPPAASALGNPRVPGDALAAGPLLGSRLGFYPTRRVGLELEAALGLPRYQMQIDQSLLVVSRLSLGARAIEDGRFGLRLLAGVDLLGVLVQRGTSQHDAAAGIHDGMAFTIELSPATSLRFQALHVVTSARDGGYAHAAELQIGFARRLGRRDRW